jgi:hypothetical protein
MRSIRFEALSRCGAPSAIGDRIEDVGLACAIVRGAVANAEGEIASRSWSPADLALVQHLRRVDAACVAFERALAPPVHMPSAATLKTIARVEAVRASMPSDHTRATIAIVEAAHHAVSRQLKG